jgi:AraC-like DNA-binding protein
MTPDWVRYWRSPEAPLEAMHAHFERHVYHRHSHQTYSFGVTEDGAQSFTCRGSARVSGAGMVMAFNPDDPHDGHATDELGFTYRIVHLGVKLVAEVLADTAESPAGLPLFAEPVVTDPVLATALRELHRGLLRDAIGLRRDELVARAVRAMVRRGARSAVPVARLTDADAVRIARLTRRFLDDWYRREIGSGELAAVAGRSRFAVYRAFRARYGIAPSDYQRQLRLREARRLLAADHPPAAVASQTGFADQSHLTRWFIRYFGITPAVYRRGAAT